MVLAVIMMCKVITTATFFLSWLFSRRNAESRHDTTDNQETHFLGIFIELPKVTSFTNAACKVSRIFKDAARFIKVFISYKN